MATTRTTGSVRGGEIMAVLGPSGSGKSTLVAMLTLRTATGAASGAVRIDGAKLTAARFRRSCFVVEQRDELWPYLTCRESMAYAAALYGAPGRDPDAHLDRLGLASCADTLVGTHFQPGLSGGQKRRLSIALALVKRAKCLLLDEPTSGLDAAAAFKVVTFLRELAKADKLYVVRSTSRARASSRTSRPCCCSPRAARPTAARRTPASPTSRPWATPCRRTRPSRSFCWTP